MSEFQFLRPAWLFVLLLAPVLFFLLRAPGPGESRWQRVIPPALLQPLLPKDRGSGGSPQWQRWLAPLMLVIAALAMAGPSFRSAPSPLQQQDDSLVVVLDLSLSMLARDVEPDRLTRATRKIRDLLSEREGAFTALVVYAADGHVVSPLTDDRRTVEGLLSAVDPVIMPALGNRADLGVARAVELLEQGAPGRGRILLITDDLKPHYGETIRQRLAGTPWELYGLLTGTEAGAPVPIPERGFLRDGEQIVIARASIDELRATSRATGGEALPMTTADQDIRQLRLRAEDHDEWQQAGEERTTSRRQDDGYWLLWLVLPLALLGWRRGALAMIACSLIWIPSGPARALEWDDLWQTPEQRGPELIEKDPAGAARRLEDPLWRGTALYRDGQYDSAADAFANGDSAQAHYNRGNALARAGKPEAALAAWQRALEKNPELDAARRNSDVIREFLERQEQQQKQQEPSASPDPGDDSRSGQSSSGDRDQPSPGSRPGQQDQAGGPEPGQQSGDQSGQQPGQQGHPGDSERHARQKDGAGTRQEPGQGISSGEPSGQRANDRAEGTGADALTQSQQQWLRRIPDNPGGLLRRKFMQQSRSRNIQPDENDTPW